jgi:hypothetical protein
LAHCARGVVRVAWFSMESVRLQEARQRLAPWKARERIRSAVGWVAMLFGVFGAFWIVVGAAVVVEFLTNSRSKNESWTAVPFVVLGLLHLLVARGLWNCRPWARWTAAAIAGCFLVDSLLDLAREHLVSQMPFCELFVLVYLALPSTGRHFASAGERPASD